MIRWLNEASNTTVVIVGCIAILAVVALQAWILMLVLDVLNAAWPDAPALGFWACAIMLLVINVIGGLVRVGSR